MNKKFKYGLVVLLLVIIGFGFINLSPAAAQTTVSPAYNIQQLINQFRSLVAQLQQRLAILQGQQNQNQNTSATDTRQVVFLVTAADGGARLAGVSVIVRFDDSSVGSRTTDG